MARRACIGAGQVALVAILGLTTWVPCMAADAEDHVPAVTDLGKLRPSDPFPRRASVQEPLVIASAAELAQVYKSPTRERIAKHVAFAKQQLLLFRWRGSGRDRLAPQVREAEEGAAVTFQYTPGMTRDLRPHCRLFALRKGVPWELVRRRPGRRDSLLGESRRELERVDPRGGAATRGAMARREGRVRPVDGSLLHRRQAGSLERQRAAPGRADRVQREPGSRAVQGHPHRGHGREAREAVAHRGPPDPLRDLPRASAQVSPHQRIGHARPHGVPPSAQCQVGEGRDLLETDGSSQVPVHVGEVVG